MGLTTQHTPSRRFRTKTHTHVIKYGLHLPHPVLCLWPQRQVLARVGHSAVLVELMSAMGRRTVVTVRK